MIRVTFSLDDGTVEQIRRTAARLQKPQSHIIREAVAEYAARADRLSESEQAHALAVLDRLRASASNRGAAAVDAELRGIRDARRHGGRRRRSA